MNKCLKCGEDAAIFHCTKCYMLLLCRNCYNLIPGITVYHEKELAKVYHQHLIDYHESVKLVD